MERSSARSPAISSTPPAPTKSPAAIPSAISTCPCAVAPWRSTASSWCGRESCSSDAAAVSDGIHGSVSDPRYSVVGSTYPLDSKQRALIELVDSLGPRFAERAERYDREASFPHENYADLRQAGLLGLCVPEKFGGRGADFRTYSIVSATLGKYCGATALTYNMHACSMLWPGALSDDLDMTPAQRAEHDRHRAIHYQRVIRDGAIYAQPFSEGSAAAAGRAPFGTTATRVSGGWSINGKKIFASLSPTYLGIAIAAYEFTVRYLRGEVEGMPPVKRRMYPTKQIAVAEMWVKLEQTRSLFLRMLEDARVDPPKDARLRAYAAQFTIMENANALCGLAIRTCGGQSMLKSLPLERLYRDSRCGSLMLPWTAELCLDRIGREALYEPGESDD